MRFITAAAISALTAATVLGGCRPPQTPDTAAPSATAQATQATANADAAARPSATATSSPTSPSGSGATASSAPGQGEEQPVAPAPGQPSVAAATAMSEEAQRAIRPAVLGRRTETGVVRDFTMGDYFYVNGTVNGQEATWSNDGAPPSVLPFLIAHRGQPLQISTETRRAWIHEMGGYRDEDRITGVRAGNDTDATWWAAQQRDPAARRRWARAQECVLTGSDSPQPADCAGVLAMGR